MKSKIIAIVSLGLILSSCNEWLETSPEQSLSEDLAFSSPETARAVALGAYTSLYSRNYYGRDFIAAPELMADNMKITLANTGRMDEHSTNEERAHTGDAGMWTTAYQLINRANLTLANIDGVAGMADAEKDQLKGEMYFLRALTYFDLARSYARNPNHLVNNFELAVPLLLKPFDGLDEDAFPTRETVDVVYDQIKLDLAEAITLMDDSRAPYYGSQVAAKALLARVHLYLGEWSDAVSQASDAITQSGLGLEPGATYVNIFSNDSESIFSVRMTINESVDGNNESLAVLYARDGDNGYGDVVLREDMVNQFEVGDLRASADLIEAQDHDGEPVTVTLKFYSYGGSIGVDNIPVIRLSELYLIRAEANAELGNDVPAQNDLNLIRNRAGLGNISSTGATLLQDILDERRVELAFEGHRFFDLKRRGLDIPKGVAVDDCVTCTILYEDYRVVGAVAQAELDANPNLVNNPGYSDN